MSVKVVDASAIAALLFGEPEAPTIAAQLRNTKLAAPTLLPFEVASVCLKKLHRHPDQAGSQPPMEAEQWIVVREHILWVRQGSLGNWGGAERRLL
ncbi:MAG: type II toxin-antitoxin system VapC family toxin [Pyrinomonadaceae bacterium]